VSRRGTTGCTVWVSLTDPLRPTHVQDYVGFTHGCTIAMPNCKAIPWFVGVDEVSAGTRVMCVQFHMCVTSDL
jgi:hypothetical protein